MGSLERARSTWLDVMLDVVNSYPPAMPWSDVSRILATQLDVQVAGDFGWDSEGFGRVRAYPMPDWFDLASVARRAPRAHPLALHYAASRVSDVLTTDMVPALDSIAGREYAAEMREDEIDQHLWIPVTFDVAGPRVIGACRAREAFTDEQIEIARLAQRVVVTVHRHVRALSGDLAVHWQEQAVDLRLTPRQVAVLKLAAAGLTATSIGRRLQLSPRTVERHLENAYARLDAHDRVTAIRRAESAGVLLRADVGEAPWSRIAGAR